MQTNTSMERRTEGFSLGGTLAAVALMASVVAIGGPVVVRELRSRVGRTGDSVRRMEASVADAMDDARALGQSVSGDAAPEPEGAMPDYAGTPIWIFPQPREYWPQRWMQPWRNRPYPAWWRRRPLMPPEFRPGAREPLRKRRRRHPGRRPRQPGRWPGSGRPRHKEKFRRHARPAEYGGPRANPPRPLP